MKDRIIRTILAGKGCGRVPSGQRRTLWIGEKGFLSCTPAGIIQLLKRSGIEIEGKECVIVGRSNIVGKPMAALLLRENGTVTVTHSRTKDLKNVTGRADILIVAIGRKKIYHFRICKRRSGRHRCGDAQGRRRTPVAATWTSPDVEPHTSAITPVSRRCGPYDDRHADG